MRTGQIVNGVGSPDEAARVEYRSAGDANGAALGTHVVGESEDGSALDELIEELTFSSIRSGENQLDIF
jgi:hypothetical protein